MRKSRVSLRKRRNGEYCSLRVPEDTRRLAKELSARAGMPMKDFVKAALEMSRKQSVEGFSEREKARKRFGFDFSL